MKTWKLRYKTRKWKPECQKDVEPFFQCCCECIFLVPDVWHCSVNPEAHDESLCYKQRGWACTGMNHGADARIISGWAEHSCGCEMHTKKEASDG